MKNNEQHHHIELFGMFSVSPESLDSSSFDSSSLDEDGCNGGYEMMNEKKRRDECSIVSNQIESI